MNFIIISVCFYIYTFFNNKDSLNCDDEHLVEYAIGGLCNCALGKFTISNLL